MNPENTQTHDNVNGRLIRLLRPSIVVLCGPAACGKTTFAEKHFRPTQVISSDRARAWVCDDERDQRFNAQAFALVHFLVEQRLLANRLCVVDSTALTSQARKELLDLAKKYQVPTTLLLFHVPLETCVERDQHRERSVGRVVVERQFKAFEEAQAAIAQEGFTQVVGISNEELEKVQIEILFRPVVRSAQRPDAGAPRRIERTSRPSRPHPERPGGNGHVVSSIPPAIRPGTVPKPATTPGSVATPKPASPRPVQTPPPGAGTQTSSAAQVPVPPAVEKGPDSASPAGEPANANPDKSPKVAVE